MIEKVEKKRLAILRLLKDADHPMTGSFLTEELNSQGHDMSERTVRLYLQDLAEDGLIENIGKRQRSITRRGLEELDAARVVEKVGFLSAKIDQMTYLMNFQLTRKSGTVVINLSVMKPADVLLGCEKINQVFHDGYAMGRLITLVEPGERVGDVVIPKNMVGVGTVCSITLNGVLLHEGIPTESRFGGLLQIKNKKPVRFVELIMYDGTTLDPLEIFIKSGMTDYLGAISTGSGRIGASFREFPEASRSRVMELADALDRVGLGGFMRIGLPGKPLLEIPVGEGRVGAIVIGGLNPIATLEEAGIRVYSRALAGLIEYDRLFPHEELPDRLRKIVNAQKYFHNNHHYREF